MVVQFFDEDLKEDLDLRSRGVSFSPASRIASPTRPFLAHEPASQISQRADFHHLGLVDCFEGANKEDNGGEEAFLGEEGFESIGDDTEVVTVAVYRNSGGAVREWEGEEEK